MFYTSKKCKPFTTLHEWPSLRDRKKKTLKSQQYLSLSLSLTHTHRNNGTSIIWSTQTTTLPLRKIYSNNFITNRFGSKSTLSDHAALGPMHTQHTYTMLFHTQSTVILPGTPKKRNSLRDKPIESEFFPYKFQILWSLHSLRFRFNNAIWV